jgi:hypothetical protein
MTAGYHQLLVPEALAKRLVLNLDRAVLPVSTGGVVVEWPASMTHADVEAALRWLADTVAPALQRLSQRERNDD